MPEQIDELFVRLGLEQDQQQFQQAQSSFDSLRSAALQFGAVIGAGFGLNELTFGFAKTTNEARKLSEVFEGLDVTPQFVDSLKGAFRLIDEDASEAASTIQNIAQIIEDTDWGEISDQAFARGFDISGIEDAENMTEALAALNEQFRSMEDPERARRLAGALGLSDAQFRLMRQTDIGQQMRRAAELRPLDQGQAEAAEEFTQGWQELSLAMEGLQRQLSETFVGDLGEGMSEMAELLAENRDAIENFASEVKPILAGMAGSLGILVAYRTARSALGIFSKVPFLTLLGGAAAGGTYKLIQDIREREEQETPDEFIDRQIRETEDMSRDEARQRYKEILPKDMENQFSEPGGISTLGPDNYRPYTSRFNTGNNYNINIDARNSTDPQAVRENARRGAGEALRESAETTIEDFATGVE